MYSYKASIVIHPINNDIGVIEALIRSTLDQNFNDFEVIVLDNTSNPNFQSIDRIKEAPLRTINYQEGDLATRNVWIESASGELIFFLQPENHFHPDKLREHISFHALHPEVVLTYNSCFISDDNGEIWIQNNIPPDSSLADFVSNFPIMLSDIVVKRSWILEVDSFKNENGSANADIAFITRCLIEGCKTAAIDRPLNYHVVPREVSYDEVENRVSASTRDFEELFSHRRCPRDIRRRRDRTLGRIYFEGAIQSFFQNKTSSGQDLLRNAIRLDRSILDNQAEGFLDKVIFQGLPNGENLEILIRKLVYQLPPELEWISQYLNQTISQGYFQRGVSNLLWGRCQQSKIDFQKASQYGLNLDKRILVRILSQVSNFETEFGSEKAHRVVQCLGQNLKKVGMWREARWIVGTYLINRAFNDYSHSSYKQVLIGIIQATIAKPILIFNRGVWSLFLQSLIKIRQ